MPMERSNAAFIASPMRPIVRKFRVRRKLAEKRHQPARKLPKSHSVVKVGRTSVGAARTSAAAVRSFFVATAFLVTARRFFFAAFLPADFIFRVRIAFFVAALRFLAMGIFLSTSNMCTARIRQHMKGR